MSGQETGNHFNRSSIVRLSFSQGKQNTKLVKLQKQTGKRVVSFSLLSGHTCPGAKDCQSFAVETPEGMRIQDGKHTDFRCFSASQEVLFPAVYKSRKANGDAILTVAAKNPELAATEIVANIPKKTEIIRVHVAGDFKTKNYFLAWILAAKIRPDIVFYAYTKSIPFWVKLENQIPENFVLTASMGGKYDALAIEHGYRTATVFDYEHEAIAAGYDVDHTDYFAYDRNYRKNFALTIHGPQPKGSKRGKASWANKKKAVKV